MCTSRSPWTSSASSSVDIAIPVERTGYDRLLETAAGDRQASHRNRANGVADDERHTVRVDPVLRPGAGRRT